MIAAALNNGYSPVMATDQFANDDNMGNGMIRDIERGDRVELPDAAPTQIPSIASVELTVMPQFEATQIMPLFKIPIAEFRNMQLNLGDGYQLTVDERNQNLLLENTQHELRTLIWGDARVSGNTLGEPLQFWGTTSFVFGKESKITLETSQSQDNKAEYRLDKISVSTADRGMVITGLANDIAGDLTITDFKKGYIVDDAARDGFTLTESIPVTSQEIGTHTAEKTTWLDDDDLAVTQALLDATAVGRIFGPGSDIMSRMEFSQLMSRFFSSWGLFSTMLLSNAVRLDYGRSNESYTNDRNVEDSKASERRLIERLIIEQALVQDMQIERAAMHLA